MISRAMAETENTERLQKFLAHSGVASRRECEKLIVAGRITVNGKKVLELGTKVDPERDEVRVDTELIGAPKRPLTYLVWKPRGFVCTTKDERGRRTVLELVPDTDRRLYPIGRLDEDSDGLILVSDDGALTNLVTHPRYGIPKTYDLRIRGKLESVDVRRVESGVWLAEGKTGPTRIRVKKRGRDISRVEVTLTEGRNRELRRIFARIGHPVLSLRRIRIGPLSGRRLRIGQYRRLSGKEIGELKAMAKKA
jgi:23S rRNA pseudouridine2605 synthase